MKNLAVATVVAFGESKTISQLAKEHNMHPFTLRQRLATGVSVETALTLPAHCKMPSEDDPGPGYPGSASWFALEWEEDPWAQEFVRENPEGATLEAVGEQLGLCRERINQIERAALKKLRKAHPAMAAALEETRSWWDGHCTAAWR